MASYGLIGNIAGGIRETMNQYQTMQNQKRQQKMMGLLQGVQDNEQTGEMEFTPEEQEKRHLQMGLLKSQIAKNYRGRADEIDLTPGEKATDITFGKEYAEYGAGGGSANVDKNMGLLKTAIDDLKSKKVNTGGISGALPEWAQDYVSSDVSGVRDQIRTAIQGTLKQVMGGQFTEREASAMFNRAFNPRLSNEENIRRAEAELSALQQMTDSKNQAGSYYQKHGTLKGFKQSQGLLRAISQPKNEGPKPGDEQDGYVFKGGDPANPKSWAKK